MTLVNWGLPLFLAGAVGILLVSSTPHLWLLIASLWISIAMVGSLSANLMSLAMRAYPERRGAGSALLGALQFAIAFTCSTIVGDTAAPLGLGISCPVWRPRCAGYSHAGSGSAMMLMPTPMPRRTPRNDPLTRHGRSSRVRKRS
ncbi:hypothetical protein [Breoghania sp.]|uniref:hypothetical protein n=1 Tax=Breoghania sp. TaxID=2065378 RepID=UPI002633006C|nr:hypothetical protein [Breoghania sp.]MDJ0931057.1 hypothetical protein [Breoghania sp.]